MITAPVLMLVVLALSGLTIAMALRGRPVLEHRRCSSCEYDLSGSDPLVMRCPECGADLSPYRAVVIHSRVVRRRLLACGIVVFAGVAVVFGVRTVQWFDRVDWPALKPQAWLVYRAASSDADTATAALDELIRRAERSALDNDRLRALGERGLERQADVKIDWEPRWGIFIERAIRAELLSAAQRDSYVQRSLGYSMALQRPRTSEMGLDPGVAENARLQRRSTSEPLHVKRFECFDIEFVATSLRAGKTSRIAIEARPLSATVGDWQCPDLPAERARLLVFSNRSTQTPWIRVERMLWLPAVVEPDEYSVKMRWEVRARLEDDPPDASVVTTMQFEQSVVVEPPDERTVPIVTDAASTQVLKGAFHVDAFGFRRYTLHRRQETVTIIYVRFDSGPSQRLKHEDPLAPFNGALDIEVRGSGELLYHGGSSLPGAWIPVVVDDDQITTIDLLVHYSQDGRSVFVGEGPGFGGQFPQPIWMGPPFEVNNIPVTWFDDINHAPLTGDELESLRFAEPG